MLLCACHLIYREHRAHLLEWETSSLDIRICNDEVRAWLVVIFTVDCSIICCLSRLIGLIVLFFDILRIIEGG